MLMSPDDLSILGELERKVLWLATWTIHHANNLRDSLDGLKVGGHQASSASLATIMTALYFRVLRPQDRVAVKPHASPNFHAIEYLLGKQTRNKLANFRGYKGAQSYPSRTKDVDDVDPGQYDALAIAGGRAPEYLRLNQKVIDIVRQFAEQRKPIAAICHAAQLLAAADVIRGKRISAYPACAPEVKLAGGEYADIPVDAAITDGNFVTAPAWPAHPEWLRQFLVVLGTRIEL